ncbi:MAG: hypothetical protein C0609_09085 [Deltaproteobacteria bacterium]|nr:MAG: hypothetical protein C0609_09085 [Deltaproteobacteria bacterium]
MKWLEERFGIDENRFEEYALLTYGEQINAAPLEAGELSDSLAALETGLPLVKVSRAGMYKPSTRGMQVFGVYATKNTVEVGSSGMKDLVEGRAFPWPGEKGFVIVTVDGFPAGVALCREGRLISQLPKMMTSSMELSGREKLGE